MAEGQNSTVKFLDGLEIAIDTNPEGIQFYHVTDHNELDPNGDPVIYEITASEYIELANTLGM